MTPSSNQKNANTDQRSDYANEQKTKGIAASPRRGRFIVPTADLSALPPQIYIVYPRNRYLALLT